MFVVKVLSLVSLALVAACESAPAGIPSCAQGPDAPSGSCLGDGGLYYEPCTGNVVSEIPVGDCPTKGCVGTAFAVCSGGSWSMCACSIPPGYSPVDAGFFGPEGGADGGEDGGMEAGTPRDGALMKDALSPQDAYGAKS